MKHIVSLESKYELIYANAAKFAGISIDEILEIVLAEYVVNLIPKNKKALS